MCNIRKNYVAHVCGQQENTLFRMQTLEKHLRNVAELTEIFAAKAGLPLSGRLI